MPTEDVDRIIELVWELRPHSINLRVTYAFFYAARSSEGVDGFSAWVEFQDPEGKHQFVQTDAYYPLPSQALLGLRRKLEAKVANDK